MPIGKVSVFKNVKIFTCRVDVLITAHFPFRFVNQGYTFAPSSSPKSWG
jgi:hypothetical protein